jgi:hypothetical protein
VQKRVSIMQGLAKSFAFVCTFWVSSQLLACGHIHDTHFLSLDSGDTLAVWTSSSPHGGRCIQAGVVDKKDGNDVPVTLSLPEMHAFQPCVTSKNNGSFVVAWVAIDKQLGLYRVYYSTLVPGGSWSIPQPLSREIDNVETFYGIQTNGKGTVIAKWRSLNIEDSKGYIVVGSQEYGDRWQYSQFFYRD